MAGRSIFEMTEVPFKSNAAVVQVVRRTARGPEILLLKRSKGDGLDNLWLYVAGRIEAGEQAWQTALRELKEETGLMPQEFYSANFCEQFYSVAMNAICVLPVFVTFVDEGQQVRINHEHSEFRWFSFEEARSVVSMNNQRECLDVVELNFIKNAPCDFARIEICNPKT